MTNSQSGVSASMAWASCFWLTLFAALGNGADSGSPLIINQQRLHLGVAGKPEWEEFAGHTPAASRLDLHFQAQTNRAEATLFIRQDDVRQDWFVELNGRRVGKLFLMEADLIRALSVPPGALRQGENVLSLIPPKEIDDIVVREIRLDPRPLDEALQEAKLALRVTEAPGHKPLSCRLTIVDQQGT